VLEFRLPDIGEGLTEAEIVSWMVQVGDAVKEDQAIVAIETDKAVVEMPAPATGIVVRLGGQPGDVVKVGEVLVVIDDGGAPSASASAGAEASAAVAAPPPVAAAVASAPPAPPAAAAPRAGRPLATPATRGLARRLGVELAAVRGTGPGGRVTDADVEAAAAAPRSPATDTPVPVASGPPPGRAGAAAPAPVAGQRIPLRGVRKRTAETMTAAWQAVPHINSFHEVDVNALFDLRRQLKPVAAARGVDLTLTAFLVKATGLALAEQPTMNASLDVAAGEIVLHAARNVAVAVDTDDGLVLPVIRDADTTPLFDIARELNRTAELARTRRLTPAEMAGSTFTVSNHGVFGGWFGTSLVRGAEVGILGFGPATDRALVVDGQVVARKVMVLNAGADHRVVDGRDLIRFCAAVRRALEAPVSLLADSLDRHP
jgi:pyruvate/2-oxoglutarate dehydrogenase complex dihydrolipoamide acyltransferase (E2) component